MSEPIDIKTKKIIPQPVKQVFEKSIVHEALQKNIISHWDTWGKLQSLWTNRAYKTFKDFDKYLVLIYLVRDNWQQSADKFEYYSFDEFYNKENVVIDKINLIKIASELNIPKETVRRKVNELQREDILSREGKKIILTRKAAFFQKPQASLEALGSFLEKKSKILAGEEWFGNSLNKNEIIEYIEKYFTVIWLRFLKLQIPFLLRHKANFGDLETWMVWGNVAINHQKNLAKQYEQKITTEENLTVNHSNYFGKVSDVKIIRGVNASSISDITSIPRATVIRKLRWLVKQDVLKKNNHLEYIMKNSGKLSKKIELTFKTNQLYVADFLTDFFDYYKNSNFKP
jgi:DNA-binding Lrp family transcriptional regulator